MLALLFNLHPLSCLLFGDFSLVPMHCRLPAVSPTAVLGLFRRHHSFLSIGLHVHLHPLHTIRSLHTCGPWSFVPSHYLASSSLLFFVSTVFSYAIRRITLFSTLCRCYFKHARVSSSPLLAHFSTSRTHDDFMFPLLQDAAAWNESELVTFVDAYDNILRNDYGLSDSNPYHTPLIQLLAELLKTTFVSSATEKCLAKK